MKHGSLFSGIGGFDLAAQWMGWENVFHCEIAEFPRKVLHHYWPNAISYENIIETDFTKHRGHIDIISGGFPCQPYSLAGKRLGKEDARHLWPEMLRVIREIQPRWVVGENVFGLVNWNGGLVFNEVQSDLEAEGYEVQAYVLPACAVNAPHRRDRVWFVAYAGNNATGKAGNSSANEGTGTTFIHPAGQGGDRETILDSGLCDLSRPAPHTPCQQSERLRPEQREFSEPQQGQFRGDGGAVGNTISYWERFPATEPTIRRGDDGISSRLDGITFSKWRNESIKAYGNAVVPQVVFQIFKAIHEYENKY
jgi:DNA (cytosine-5)-methyltransferase 1